MPEKKTVNILFIGNSHTFYNDLPLTVCRLAEADGWTCRVTMLAHGGWFLAQHVGEPDVRFDILHGGYDYVVLQEHAHPFGPVEKFREAALALNGMIREAGCTPVLYETWAQKAEPQMQPVMNAVHREIAREIDALLAPVGERWQAYRTAHPDIEMYADDGAHASPAGSAFAAAVIWETVRDAAEKQKNQE
ncbi:MAG: SGNH/GDSL hydrolase family protein [Clostridiales bacterium]|nr:SGNH/GDSL hydrolase family protein [Clostridiales bacterium]